MTTLKNLMIIGALFVGGSGPFSAAANELPDSSGASSWPSAAAPPSPAASIPPRTVHRSDTKHHFPRMFMSTGSKKGAPKTNLPKGAY
jgi:hypothetical protein